MPLLNPLMGTLKPQSNGPLYRNTMIGTLAVDGGTLKPQSNGPLYRNTMIGTLAVDGWAVTFGTVSRGLDRVRPRPVSPSLYQM